MTLRDVLDRTLRLMRDELVEATPDDLIVAALANTRVALVADAENLTSHSAQTAFVTAALLMARSGHCVYLLAPDVSLIGPQPPLQAGAMISSLLAVGRDLLPGVEFSNSIPTEAVDLVVVLGDSRSSIYGHSTISINADDWSGSIDPPTRVAQWRGGSWPLGAMAAAALAGTEAFKCTMRKLRNHARNARIFAEMFAPSIDVGFAVAPAGTTKMTALGEFDFVSGGAITQSVFFALSRIPGVCGNVRVIEPENSDLTNLNRYMLLMRSRVGSSKCEDLAQLCAGSGLTITPIVGKYEPDTGSSISLREVALVGADDIPTRWHVQRAWPIWLGIGATTHWSAMASFHIPGAGGCAECLHPRDEAADGPIPTAAFISFWSGLLLTGYFLRHLSAEVIAMASDQQVFVTPIRPESSLRNIVPIKYGCKTCTIAPHNSAAAVREPTLVPRKRP